MTKMKYEELRLRYDIVREACADAFERRNHMEQVEAPALSSQYMLAVGQHEIRVFELSVELRRWRRRFELYQSAVNCGKSVDMLVIESTLDREFEEFRKKIADSIAAIDNASAYFQRGTLASQDATKMRLKYLAAAKRLHPDVNPDASEAAVKLWHRIRAAYAACKWSELEFLCTLIDAVATPAREFADTPDGLAALAAEIARMEEVVRVQREEMDVLRSQAPLSYREFLDNPEEVELRQQTLMDEIASLCKQVRYYERKWRKEVAHD